VFYSDDRCCPQPGHSGNIDVGQERTVSGRSLVGADQRPQPFLGSINQILPLAVLVCRLTLQLNKFANLLIDRFNVSHRAYKLVGISDKLEL
jgi:hypothetical protein